MADTLSWEILAGGDPATEALTAFNGPRFESWLSSWLAMPPEHRDPFTHPVWLLAWYRHRGGRDGADRRLALLRRGETVLTGAPIALSRRPTGLNLIHDDDSTLEGAALAGAPELLTEGLDRLFATAIDGRRPAALHLGKHDAGGAWVQGLGERARFRSMRSVIPIAGGWEAVEARVGKNFRGNLRKARNRLEAREQVTFETLRGAEALRVGLPRLIEVEAKSWKGRAQSSIRDDAAMRGFLTQALEGFAPRDEAIVHVLRCGEADLAAQFCLQLDDALHVVKIGYDESESRLAPGNLLLERTIRSLPPDGPISRISLVTDQPWHEKWKPQRVETYRVTCYAPGHRGWLARAGRFSAKQAAKQWLHRRGWLDKLRPRPQVAHPGGGRNP